MINDSEILKRMKSEKAADENFGDLMDKLEKILKNS